MRSWDDMVVLPPPYLRWTAAPAPMAAAPPWTAVRISAAHRWASLRPAVPRALRWARSTAGATILTVASVVVALLAGWLDEVPLLSPVLAVLVESAAVAALLASWYRREDRWWSRQVPRIMLGAAAVTGSVALYLRWSGTVVDAYPRSFFVWTGVAVAALLSVPVTARSRERQRRLAAAAAVPLTAAGAFLLINDQYGMWPHLGDLLGHDDKISTAELFRQLNLPPGSHHSNKGLVADVDIRADRSRFAHRQASVYLPPAYFTGLRADLPVLVFVPGVPGAPDHWISAGAATKTADAFAAGHHGTAPIMLFVDGSGPEDTDAGCVDGPQGNAETYLTVDVPAFVAQTLHVPHDVTRWGIVGFSAGGTCAVMLTLTHPQVFSAFVDVAGDLAPTVGTAKNTLETLFGGSEQARDAHDPLLLLGKNRYKGVTGWFTAGARDTEQRKAGHTLAVAARRAGATAHEVTADGGHDWGVASGTLRQVMPDLCRALGTR